ncbi:class I SAM-dependent methyltransferase [Bacillus tianshenii]|nr:class I SAM-dependent methyltransferase [Bacillus tianshenii]
MAYEGFAYLYDELMSDAPYDSWTEFVQKQANNYNIEGKRLLDLACGTGELSVRLAEKGWVVTGADLSEDMLAVAQQKAHMKHLPITFLKQDMAKLSQFEPFDIITIFCDSLNYLQTEEDVKETFSSVYENLTDNGLFLFDVHTVYKMKELFIGQTYASNDPAISFIWQCFEGETPLTVEHDLTFFVEDNGIYERFDETHVQRTYPEESYDEWLREAGFLVEKKVYDFHSEKHDANERLFYVAKKIIR